MDDNDCKSNKEFAELVGVSTPVISKAVNFAIVPTLRTLVRIADKLDLSIKYLLGLTETNDFIGSATPTTFRERIKELTDEENTNFGQLVNNMYFPRTYIYEWQKENTYPSIDFVFEMSKHFNVSPDYLLGRTDYRK